MRFCGNLLGCRLSNVSSEGDVYLPIHTFLYCHYPYTCKEDDHV